MGSPQQLEAALPGGDPQSQVEYCKQIADAAVYSDALEKAARTHTEIIFGMFFANLLMVFTGRILLRDEPYKVKILGSQIYEFDKTLPQQYVYRLDRMLFAFNFMLVSFLFVVQFAPVGFFRY